METTQPEIEKFCSNCAAVNQAELPQLFQMLIEPCNALIKLCAVHSSFTAVSEMGADAKCLADAIARAAIKAGIITGKQPLDGPQLVLLCDDLATLALRQFEQL
jgi:hypothetical protein